MGIVAPDAMAGYVDASNRRGRPVKHRDRDAGKGDRAVHVSEGGTYTEPIQAAGSQPEPGRTKPFAHGTRRECVEWVLGSGTAGERSRDWFFLGDTPEEGAMERRRWPWQRDGQRTCSNPCGP